MAAIPAASTGPVRLVLRHLPSAYNTVESVELFLEQNGGFTKERDNVKVHRVLVGKVGTNTKQEVPSVAFVTVPNEQTGLRLCKKLNAVPQQPQQPAPVRCEMAIVQKVPHILIPRLSVQAQSQAAESVPGTWQSDPAYLDFSGASRVVVVAKAAAAEDSEETAVVSAPKEIAALVAHMRREMLLKRNKTAKQNDSRQRKKVSAAASTSGPVRAAAKTSQATKPAGAAVGQQRKQSAVVGGARQQQQQPKQQPGGRRPPPPKQAGPRPPDTTS